MKGLIVACVALSLALTGTIIYAAEAAHHDAEAADEQEKEAADCAEYRKSSAHYFDVCLDTLTRAAREEMKCETLLTRCMGITDKERK